MKIILRQLFYEAERNLKEMKKERMLLSDRVKYERALTQLQAMKLVIDQIES